MANPEGKVIDLEKLHSLDMKKPNEMQQVKTILSESGLELVPNFSARHFVERNIKRVWSTLFGWDGSNLRMVRVDGNGKLQISDTIPTNTQYEEASGSIELPFADMNVTLTNVCHTVQILAVGGVFRVTFGLAPGSHYGCKIATPRSNGGSGGNASSMVEIKGAIKDLTIQTIVGDDPYTFNVVGLY